MMLQRLLLRQKWARKMTADAQRKADTYRKILLGGLVIKAGVGDADKAVILGALLDAKARCDRDPAERERLKTLGDREFGKGQ
jgi:hypothetical protein